MKNQIKKEISKRFNSSKKRIKYKFHKWENQLIIADKALYIIIVLLLGVFRPDFLMIAVYFLLYPYLFLTARKKAVTHLLIASAVSLMWVLIANSQYGYNQKMLLIFGLNSYPLFTWAIGLFAAYLIYSHWEHLIKKHSLIKKMLLFTAFYWLLLISVEATAYHTFNIKNLATASYVGLPFCNCIHAPLWMQISYILLGPLYFGICELIGLENPHHKKRKNNKNKNKKDNK